MSPAAKAWPCSIEGQTVRIDGAPVEVDRAFDGSGDVYGAALQALLRRKDKGRAFVGCGLWIHTPLHNLEVVVEQEEVADAIMGLVLQRQEAGKWVTVAREARP